MACARRVSGETLGFLVVAFECEFLLFFLVFFERSWGFVFAILKHCFWWEKMRGKRFKS